MGAVAPGGPLPTVVLALDLSLTATGMFCGDPMTPGTPHVRDEVRTPDRRAGESDPAWNRRRYQAFCLRVGRHIRELAPEVVVVEVTSHAHQVTTRGRGTDHARRVSTTRGLEFRAGLGLGRALGWLDAVCTEMAERGEHAPPIAAIEAGDAKLRVAGSQAASKGAVAAKLAEVWGWTTNGWRESEIDALACAVAWVRTADMAEKERTYRAIADAQDRPRPSGSRARRRKSGSPAPSS